MAAATACWLAAWLATMCAANATPTCLAATGSAGVCLPLHNCSSLHALSRSKIDQDVTLLRKSACGFTPDGRPKVCCPPKVGSNDSDTNLTIQSRSPSTPPPPPPTQSQWEQFLALNQACPPTSRPPSPDCCGIDSSGGNRIIGGTETALDQYPWLALLEYHSGTRVQLSCAGSLISARYVLTAAHCVNSRLTNVRLAEYNTSSHPQDCVITDGFGLDCSTVLVVPIAQHTVHPGYIPGHPDRLNDIALLRLQEYAPYTDFIRPICLPSDPLPTEASNLTLVVAGWGSDGHAFSEVKKHVAVPHVAVDECRDRFNTVKNGPHLTEKHVCAGAQGLDSCRGDSGGPLMLTSSGQLQLAGVVSSGAVQCGHARLPGLYTAVYPFRRWILDHTAV